MIHRIRYERTPVHTRCRWFCGPEDGTLALAGELVFRNEEFEPLRERLEDGAGVRFVDETDTEDGR